MDWIYFLSSNQQPHPFFIHQRTPDKRGVAPLPLALRRQHHEDAQTLNKESIEKGRK